MAREEKKLIVRLKGNWRGKTSRLAEKLGDRESVTILTGGFKDERGEFYEALECVFEDQKYNVYGVVINQDDSRREYFYHGGKAHA